MRKGQIPELQAIRGIAATVVLFGHSFEYYPLTGAVRDLSHVLFNGHGAVIIFFVLSGFVLTNSLRAVELNPSYVMSYYIKRAFRIYPAIWAASALGLLYIFGVHFNGPPTNTSAWFERFYTPERLSPLFITASLAGASAHILPPLWSIFVEIIASGAMPFIAFLAYRKKQGFLLAAALALLISVTIGKFTYYEVGVCLFYFFVGAAVCAFPEAFERFWRGMGRWKYVMFGTACIGMFAGRAMFLPFYPTPLTDLVDGICAVLIVSAVVCGNVVVPLLTRESVVLLGDISFSVYLAHFPVLCVVGKALNVAIATYGLTLTPLASASILSIATLLLTLPLSWVLYVYVEKAGIRVGAHVVAFWRRLAVPAAPS